MVLEWKDWPYYLAALWLGVVAVVYLLTAAFRYDEDVRPGRKARWVMGVTLCTQVLCVVALVAHSTVERRSLAAALFIAMCVSEVAFWWTEEVRPTVVIIGCSFLIFLVTGLASLKLLGVDLMS